MDIILDINFENVCRLCLGQNGAMTRIYDASGQSLLIERILSLASVQILPDDGLPGLVCSSCQDKIDKFVKFREQIENSHYLLCQCIGVDPNETDTSYADPGTSSLPPAFPTAKPREKDKSPKSNKHTSKLINKNNEEDEVANSLSSLFKDHLVSGISNADLLVNPQDGYINVNNVGYSSISEDVYKNTDNYMSIALSEEGIVDPQQANLLTKELNSVLSNGDAITDAAFNVKLHDSANDGKIYNISFSDNNTDNSEALHDIFQVLENDEDGYQNGFDDITKFLKTSQNIDFKKLKEEIKIIKDKNERNDCEVEIDPDSLIKKLASRGVTFVKKEEDLDVYDVHSFDIASDSSTSLINTKVVTQEASVVPTPSMELTNEIEVETEQSDDLNNTPDIIFAKMQAREREVFTLAVYQEEVVPRIGPIYSLDLDQNDHSQIIEGKTEKELLKFNTYLCHLCLQEFRECDINVLNQHASTHFSYGNIIGETQMEPLFRCEFCSERFNDRHLFIIHQRKHLAIKAFSCTVCYKSFAQTEKLSDHMENHVKSVSNQHPCFYCGKVFNKKQELQYHERTHVSATPLVCTTCNKTFSNIITLKMHKKRHTESSKHCCQKCGKACYSSTQLKRHEQSHSGERRFPCNFCTKAFYSNAERRRHLLYHFKTKKFKCEECDKAFYESGHLTIHMRSHTNFKPYICDVCGKAFPTRVKLMRHLTMHEKRALGPAEIRDRQLLKKAMPKAVPKSPKTKVTPKFTKLNPANKKVSTVNMLGENSSMSNSVSIEVLNNLRLQNLQDDDDESYIIIEEEDDSNGDEQITDFETLNGVQVFTDDNGEVFYVLDDEGFSNFDHSNGDEGVSGS